MKPVSLREALPVWARIGILGFGGPAGQIALMQRILVEEKRWLTYDPLCSGIPPWEAPAPVDAKLPSRRTGSKWWSRRPRWPGRTLADCRGSLVTELEATALPASLAEGPR